MILFAAFAALVVGLAVGFVAGQGWQAHCQRLMGGEE